MANNSRSIRVNRDVLPGVVFALLAALGFSAKAILVKLAYLDNVDAARFTAYAMVVACVASLLQFGVMRPMSALDLPLRVYELSIAMAIFSTVLPAFLLAHAIRRIGSGSTSLIGTIGPVSTIYMAHVFLGERISPLQIAGASLVLIGVLVISMNSKREGK